MSTTICRKFGCGNIWSTDSRPLELYCVSCVLESLLLTHSRLVRQHLEAFTNGDYDSSNKLYSEANLVFDKVQHIYKHERNGK